MKSGLRLSYSKAGRQKEVGENLFTIKGGVSAPVRDPSEEEAGGGRMCTKPASSNQMWPFYARTFLLNTCQPSAGSKIWEQDGNKQKALHTATAALKGGGGERKGKMGEENENEQNGTLKRLNQQMLLKWDLRTLPINTRSQN